ncbi:MAG: glycosyltransferase, partial [bacterium]|nr:glycosyltransferase [bacterium]
MKQRIALVHDQLQEFGGAERVFVTLTKLFPDADIFTAFYNPQALGIHNKHFKNRTIVQSWASKIPFFGKLYSPLRFFAPAIWESFDFSQYDVVITSSGWYMCKGIKTNENTKHICYLHHPPRYLYGYETAVEWQKYWPVKIYAHIVNHYLRQWDFESSKRPDVFIANSEETKKRIKKFYRRDAEVIYPPVDIPPRVIQTPSTRGKNPGKDGYYITLSRLARAKHIDVLIRAANKAKFTLKVIGIGRDEEYLKSIAGPTVEFLHHIPDEQFKQVFAGAKAFLIAAQDEEFGIAPIEAMGYGIP